MNAFNNLRDRLLLRLLSQPTRDALFRVVMSSIDAEINHYSCNEDPEHIAVHLCHLADLMEEKPQWVAELNEATANG